MIITCIAVYILSAFLVWLHVHISYSKGGIYENEYYSPTLFAVGCMLIPIINTLVSLLWVFDFPFIIKKNSIKKFFMIRDK